MQQFRHRRKAATAITAAGALLASMLVAGAGPALAASPTGDSDVAECAPAWDSTEVYTNGGEVSVDGENFTAKWWTLNNAPGGSEWGPWSSQGTCGEVPDPDPTTDPTEEPTDEPTEEPTEEPTDEPTEDPTTDPTEDPAEPANPDEICRPDGLATDPELAIPYCDIYDEDGREILPNGLDRRVIGYFTSWRTGKNGAPQYLADDIPWDKLSHINYAFAHIDGDSKVSVNSDVDGNEATGMTWPDNADAAMDPEFEYDGHFNQLSKYKKENPGVKTLVSVGGWAETGGHSGPDGERVDDGGFYTMAESQEKIDAFADSAVEFIRTYGFDGVDIDYEYATSNGKAGNPDDFDFSEPRRATLWENYEVLMSTLRTKLDQASAEDGEYYMLTVAAPASGWLLRGMEVHQVVENLDYVNMMSYDLHGSWNEYVGGNAPLFDDGKDAELSSAGVYRAYDGIGYLNTDWAAHYFRGAMQAGRINVGVPFYTRGWEDVKGGIDGMGGTAPMADQNDCPPGTGVNIGSTTKCGNGATGINNLWHDLDISGSEVPSGVNPIWHMMNLENGITGDYLEASGVEAEPIVGTYERKFDSVSKAEWWWNDTTKTFLSGDADQAIAAKADYVADSGLGGIMIWELAGDYQFNEDSDQYEMGDTLVTAMHERLSNAGEYGATKANVEMPSEALDVDIEFSDFALGDNNYPITPKVTFKNNSAEDIPTGSKITFDYSTATMATMGEQNGWGITNISAGHTGDNIGGLDGDFHTASIVVPQGGIPAGGSNWAKLSWTIPIAQISNVRVEIDGTEYAITYDNPRGVTVVNPGGGTPGEPVEPGECTAPAYADSETYLGGAQVSQDGKTWTARYWTKGTAPDAGNAWGPWQLVGSC